MLSMLEGKIKLAIIAKLWVTYMSLSVKNKVYGVLKKRVHLKYLKKETPLPAKTRTKSNINSA